MSSAVTAQSERMIVKGRRVALAPGVDRSAWCERLAAPDRLLAGARRAHTSHSARVDVVAIDGASVAIKQFPPRTLIQRIGDRQQGAPARRAFDAALHLDAHGIGTPRPIAAVDGGPGDESGGWLMTEWLGHYQSFKAILIDRLTNGGEAPALVALLRVVARAVRAMHDAGVFHRDMGNQNILLGQDADGRYDAPVFIDLNRARIYREVSMGQRAFDLSRITLPSDLRRILHELYFDARPPCHFRRAELWQRGGFAVHTATRTLRHPLRTWRNRNRSETDYPGPRDLWIWDPLSVQAVAALRGAERRCVMNKGDWAVMLWASIRKALPIRRLAARLADQAFQDPVAMRGRIGLAISGRAASAAFEDACLAELGPVHVLARFYAHQSATAWDATADRLRRLHEQGHAITVVLVQDRRAVKDAERWRGFVTAVLARVGDVASELQVGQAVNRTKWGIWKLREYGSLAQVAAEIAATRPGLRLLGPAVIDYEPYYLLGLLRRLPPAVHFSGVGHLLYVDRRGAPENRQGKRDTLGKLAVLRAITRLSPRSDDRLVITETNWPLAGTGVYSPIGSPYLYTGQPVEGGVDERTYGIYMIRYLLIAICSGLADRVCWWRLSAHGFGLVDDKDPRAPRKRPAYDMLVQFVRQVGQATFVERPATAPGVYAYRFTRGAAGSVIIAYAEERATDRSLSRPFAEIRDASGRAMKSFDGQLPADGAPVYLVG